MIRHEIWFWQLIVSPHMAGLARALADMGHKVTYVAAQSMSPSRAAQGWQPSSLGNAELHLASTPELALKLAAEAPEHAVHICQGVRANGHISKVQRLLARFRRKQWVVMETVEDSGWRGFFKRLEYSRLFSRFGPDLQGVLATGYRTPAWVMGRGVSADKVFPFAYFLPDEQHHLESEQPPRAERSGFRFLFVGQFVQRKRLDLLIDAVARLNGKDIELTVVGSGPLGQGLRAKAQQKLSGRVDWVGRLPMPEVRLHMLKADCLVLPSRFDGWGAVVSEAMMAGTPVICSDRCGAAEIIYASGVGGVFAAENSDSLTEHLARQYTAGVSTTGDRKELAEWACYLGAHAGAKYLVNILEYKGGDDSRPIPPWL